MIRVLSLLAGTAVLLLNLTVSEILAQSIRDHPGYVDFDLITDAVDEEPHIEISLKGSLLRLAAEASRVGDPDLAEMLLGIKAIRVEGYKLERRDDDLADVLSGIANDISKRLRADDWDRVARFRDRQSDVHFFVKDTGERIEGLTVMVVDRHSEAIFVNIVGEIDPEEVGRIGTKFNIRILQDERLRDGE